MDDFIEDYSSGNKTKNKGAVKYGVITEYKLLFTLSY